MIPDRMILDSVATSFLTCYLYSPITVIYFIKFLDKVKPHISAGLRLIDSIGKVLVESTTIYFEVLSHKDQN